MQPEISRRCLVCGASPRAGAHFCPQCGNRLSARDAGADAGTEERADAPSAGGGAATIATAGETPDEAKREAASGEEVARAFETWSGGGEAVAQEEARPVESTAAAAEDAARVYTAKELSLANESPRANDSLAEASPSPLSAPPETKRAHESMTSEPSAAEPAVPVVPVQGPPVVDEVDGEEAGGASSSSAKTAGAVGATRRRATSVVKESIAPRVERVRDRSLVMMEEASDDSGLRFVLLAAFMFGLFILLLVLSTVIK